MTPVIFSAGIVSLRKSTQRIRVVTATTPPALYTATRSSGVYSLLIALGGSAQPCARSSSSSCAWTCLGALSSRTKNDGSEWSDKKRDITCTVPRRGVKRSRDALDQGLRRADLERTKPTAKYEQHVTIRDKLRYSLLDVIEHHSGAASSGTSCFWRPGALRKLAPRGASCEPPLSESLYISK